MSPLFYGGKQRSLPPRVQPSRYTLRRIVDTALLSETFSALFVFDDFGPRMLAGQAFKGSAVMVGQVLHFEWKERKGPSLRAFQNKGFGSLLILSIVEHDLRGKGTFFPESDGLRFAASFSPNAVEAKSQEVSVLHAHERIS
jgi:hypothetical protein